MNNEKLYNSTLINYDKIIVKSFDADDFREYNEILFSSHSCGIEGNSFSVDETRQLKEKGNTLKLQNKTMLEAFEILDHFEACKFFFDNRKENLTEDLIKEGHRILTKNTISFIHKNAIPGEYTKSQMGAGDTIFGDFEKNISLVPKLLKQTQEAINRADILPVELSARFHQYFIYLHPFRDGNGRLGRLLSNFILQKFNHPNIIIRKENKTEYINCLKASKKHNDITPTVDFFFKEAIERMKNEIAQKKNLTLNFSLGLKRETGKVLKSYGKEAK